ncbi:MAG: vgr related protein [Sphingopyxis sp.]|nr:vgr related protein [Sphingopyxis sp.]
MSKRRKIRKLSAGEIALAQSVFGDAIAYDDVRIHLGKWIFFQPRRVTMAPMGHIHFHPDGTSYCDDFCTAHMGAQAHFIHEMTHVWQAQTRGRWYLVLMRYPGMRYSYALRPGWPLARYNIEQQAEIVRHYFLLSQGQTVPGAPSIDAYRAILPFNPA